MCDRTCRWRISQDAARLKLVTDPDLELNDVERLASAHAGTRGPSANFGCADGPLFPSYVPLSASETATARRCFANRTVWFLGNSVSREWFYVFHSMLRDGRKHRASRLSPDEVQRQKQQCGQGGAYGGRRPDTGGTVQAPGTSRDCWGVCACSVELNGGSEVNFGWIYHWASARVGELLSGNGSAARQKRPDVVVYNVGLPRMVCAPCMRDLVPLEHGAQQFQLMVNRALVANPTLHFYWRTTTRICYNDSTYAQANQEIQKINDVLSSSVCTSNPLVRRLDAFKWTAPDLCWAYDDGMHHSALVFHHVTAFIRRECGMEDSK